MLFHIAWRRRLSLACIAHGTHQDLVCSEAVKQDAVPGHLLHWEVEDHAPIMVWVNRNLPQQNPIACTPHPALLEGVEFQGIFGRHQPFTTGKEMFDGLLGQEG